MIIKQNAKHGESMRYTWNEHKGNVAQIMSQRHNVTTLDFVAMSF